MKIIKYIKEHPLISILGLLGIIFFVFALVYNIKLLVNNGILNPFSSNTNVCLNEEGDMIGGIINPLLGFSISIFSALAFYMQFLANKQVQDQIKNDLIQNFLFKSIENKNNIIISYFNNIENFKDVIKKEILEKLEESINESVRISLISESITNIENVNYNNKLIKLYINDLIKLPNIDKKKEYFDDKLNDSSAKKELIKFFICSNEFLSDKIQLYTTNIQLIIQNHPEFIYSYIGQTNFILELIKEHSNSELNYQYYFNTLENTEICLILYLTLYSIPKKQVLSGFVVEEININFNIINQLSNNLKSIKYSNPLLIGQITTEEMINEINTLKNL